jgi:hypothetical protein
MTLRPMASFVSGQVSSAGAPAKQAQEVYAQLGGLLAAASMGWEDVVKRWTRTATPPAVYISMFADLQSPSPQQPDLSHPWPRQRRRHRSGQG